MTDVFVYIIVYGTIMFFISKYSIKLYYQPGNKNKILALIVFFGALAICIMCIVDLENEKREMQEFRWHVEHYSSKPVHSSSSNKQSSSSSYSGSHSSYSSSDYYDFDDFYEDTWGDYEDEDEAYEEWDRMYN